MTEQPDNNAAIISFISFNQIIEDLKDFLDRPYGYKAKQLEGFDIPRHTYPDVPVWKEPRDDSWMAEDYEPFYIDNRDDYQCHYDYWWWQ